MQNLCMSTNEEYEKIAVTIDSEASENSSHRWRSSSRTRSRRQQHQAQRTRQRAGSRQKTLSTLVRDTFEPSTVTAKFQGCTGLGQDKMRVSDTQTRRVTLKNNSDGHRVQRVLLYLTGGSKETQEQMRSSRRLVFAGGACDECEARKTEELVGLEERAESTSKGVCAERRRIQQTLLRVCLKTTSRNCVVAKS